MYLINMPLVQKWIIANIQWSFVEGDNDPIFHSTRYAFYWTLTIVISILIYKYFEIPIMDLWDKMKIK